MMVSMVSSDDFGQDRCRAAADLLRGLLDALLADGPRDAAVRKAVTQRAAALDDVADFELGRRPASGGMIDASLAPVADRP